MKKILFVIGVLLCCTGMKAQDMKSLFVALPDSLSPLLTKVNRADFGDFLASGMKAEVKNRFGNTSEMLKLTDNYLKLKVSEVSTVEMKLLPLNDSVKVYVWYIPSKDRQATAVFLFMTHRGNNFLLINF